MRRVLIVTGSYAPAMIADMHRARQLAWTLPDCGWEVEILHPDASYQPASCLDADGAAFFAPDTTAHAVGPFLRHLFAFFGIRNIGLRALWPMLRTGAALLRTRRYDLVYISTAQFILFLLGPIWRRRFGVPFVLDLHDPIRAESDGAPAGIKHRIGAMIARLVEAWAVPAASGMVSVSPRYLEVLGRRHGDAAWVAADRHAVIPFGHLPHDVEEAARSVTGTQNGALARIVYVGTGGPIMARAFSLLCRSLAYLRARGAGGLDRIRIELHGTESAMGGGRSTRLREVARDHGVADLVSEEPARVTYRRSLELLLQADGVLVLGVDDAGYMPSKLFTCAAAGIPILAIVRRDGPAWSELPDMSALGYAVWFGAQDEMPTAEAADAVAAFLDAVAGRRRLDRRASLAPYSADAMARRHAGLFASVLLDEQGR